MIDRSIEYCLWCIDKKNKKVPLYVKKQAKEYISIVKNKKKYIFFDEKKINKITGLLKLMIHPDLNISIDQGLEDYACLLICAIFGIVDIEGNRYYETVVLEIARKNFKTFNSAIIFILLMLTDDNFSRFFSVAPDLKLSSELKISVKKIITKSPLLQEAFKVLRSEVRCKITDSEYIPLAYSQDKMDGKLANAFLADEAGAMDSYPIEAMRSSQITLKSKLVIIISTKYPNDNNGFIDEVDISKKVLDGLIKDKRFSLLYEPDETIWKKDKWQKDDNVIFQANPVTVKNATVFNAIKVSRSKAILYENKKENFLCKHCNIQYKGLGVEGYIDINKIKQCVIKEDLDFWKGKSVFIGLDLSTTEDNTSVAMVTNVGDIIYSKVWGFIPTERLDLKTKKENVNYTQLIKDGVCFSFGYETIDYSEVERFIMGLEEQYGVDIV